MATKNEAPVKIGPLADRVLLRSLEEAGQTRGGLFIPDSAKEKPQQGEILAVGPGRYDEGERVPIARLDTRTRSHGCQDPPIHR